MISGATWGGDPTYLKMYRDLLKWDNDATVRAACIRALGNWGKVEDVKLILHYSQDKSDMVRWEVAKALQKIHNPFAIKPLMDMLKDDKDGDVRMAAATALAQYAQVGVFSALVGGLSDNDWGVVEASHDGLVCLTGQDCGVDDHAWLDFQRDHSGKLFDHQQVYLWQPFVKPRGFWDKIQVWNSPEEIPPRPPTGLEARAPATAPAKS
jgi:hypothetical protein